VIWAVFQQQLMAVRDSAFLQVGGDADAAGLSSWLLEAELELERGLMVLASTQAEVCFSTCSFSFA
jgi:hypothetical protein